MDNMQLLIEEAHELQTEIVEEINESTGEKQKNYYIHGIFSTPDQKNRNGRVYSKKLWESAIAGWREKVKKDNKYRLGELEHPSRVDPDPMKAVIKITSLKLEEGVVKGRAKILNDNSPETNKLKALIDEGIKIGVSSRGTGRMKGHIVEEFNLSTYDVVQSPSDYNAMLTGMVESIEKPVHLNESTGQWVCDDKGCKLEGLQEGTGSSDIAQDQQETKCSKAAKELLESLKEYTKEPEPELTEAEKKARELLGIKEAAISFKQIQKLIKDLKNKLKNALDNGMPYTEVNKIEKELNDTIAYLKVTGMTEATEATEGEIKIDEKLDRVAIHNQFTKGTDEMLKAINLIKKEDKTIGKRMLDTLLELVDLFKQTGI